MNAAQLPSTVNAAPALRQGNNRPPLVLTINRSGLSYCREMLPKSTSFNSSMKYAPSAGCSADDDQQRTISETTPQKRGC